MSTYPTVRPSLTLDFQKSKQLDPRIAFSRPQTTGQATYVQGGVVKYAYEHQARFEDKGLLIEEAKTNLVTRSEEFNDSSWSKPNSSVTPNLATSPDGSSTADKLVENSVNSTHGAFMTSAVTAVNPVFSVYAKAAGRNFLSLRLYVSGSDVANVVFSLVDGAVTSETVVGSNFSYVTGQSEALGNSWFRLSVSTTHISTSVQGCTDLSNLGDPQKTSLGMPTYQGDGSSGVYLWGAQLETGSFPTSYIPTAGSALTRSADNAQITGDNLSSWYNITEGTVCSKAMSPLDLTTSRLVWHFRNPGRKEHNADNGFQWFDIGRYATNGSTYVAGVFNKQAYAYSSVVGSSTRACLNGALFYDNPVNPNITPYTPAHTTLSLGSNVGVNIFVNGYIQRFSYYTHRLTDSEIQTITL